MTDFKSELMLTHGLSSTWTHSEYIQIVNSFLSVELLWERGMCRGKKPNIIILYHQHMPLNMHLHLFLYILDGEYAYDWDSELAGAVINGFSIGRVLT